MIPIKNTFGPTYWINPRHIIQMECREVSEYMYKHESDTLGGATHYTCIRMVNGSKYDVLSTIEELLKVINPYLQKS